MASLREQIELKEQPGFVDVPLHDQQPSRRVDLQMSGWKVVPVVCVVVVVATVAILAVVLPGHSQSGRESPLQRESQANPLGEPAAGFGIFRQMVQRIREIEAKNELKHHQEKTAKTKQEPNAAPVNPNFVKEEVPLENLPEHDVGRPLPLVHQNRRHEEIPTHPDFEQVGVELEMNVEHDSPDPTKLESPLKNPNASRVVHSYTTSGPPRFQTGTPHSPEVQQEVLATREEDTGKVTAKESQKEEKQPKESTRLPTTRLENGRRVCETPECAEAAKRISESLDLSVNPCDNFYQFACGGWIDKHPIPEETGQTGTFVEATYTLDKHLQLILENEEEPDAPQPVHMVHTFYDTCMDTDTMEDLGLSPLVSSLAGQGGWPMVLDDWDNSTFSLTTALNDVFSLNVYPLVAVGVDLDLTNTSRKIIYIDAGQVPLGFNLMANPSQFILETYTTFMSEAARQLRDHLGSSVTDEDIDHQVKEVIDFEILFTKMLLAAVNETTDSMWYTDVSGVQADTDVGAPGQFDWLEFLKEMFTGTGVTITKEEPVISFKGTFFGEFSKLLAATDPRILANAVGWWWVYELQEETTSAMRNTSFHFQQSLTGQEEPTPRWLRCITQSNVNLGFALSREYVNQFVDATAKPETTELVEHLRIAFNSLLDNNTWMLPEDLVVAREKLQAIDPLVAYPDWIMDDMQLTLGYEGLEISHGKHVENLENIGAWFKLHSLASLRETPEHSFLFPPTVVNAFYNPQENTITIMAGILQPPFYSHNSLAALNYGGIGMVIGHEMTHGFDNTGRLFDKNGNLVQWWSNATIAAYTDHAQCFIDQYSSFIPPELSEVGLNISINGVKTEGENIADNGGIREAYRAYQLYVDYYGEEARLPGLDEFTPDQLFYLGFANSWCEHKNSQSTLVQLALDAHSPGRFRVLGPLSNDEEFSKVWSCPASFPMNRGEDRCLLW